MDAKSPYTNGLCSSITESKHITAVKNPWRRSNRNQPLGQMLMTNQQSDKLAAARVDFTEYEEIKNGQKVQTASKGNQLQVSAVGSVILTYKVV